MTDVFSTEKRSAVMAAIRSTNTKPEIAVRKLLHAMGYRFRLHQKALPGNPDIVLRKHKTVIFVNGCFWHRHIGCRLAREPQTRPSYWNDKFQNNVARDQKTLRALQELGWKTVIIWECQTRNHQTLIYTIDSLISSGELPAQS